MIVFKAVLHLREQRSRYAALEGPWRDGGSGLRASGFRLQLGLQAVRCKSVGSPAPNPKYSPLILPYVSVG